MHAVEKIQRNEWAAVLFVAAIVALLLQFSSASFLDHDAFYHFKHADLYRRDGPFWGSFPWTASTVISRESGDIWYGFHLLLVPFTVFGPQLGIKLAGAAGVAALVMVFYTAGRVQGLIWPWLWPFLVLFAGPMSTARWMALRPHALSMGLAALLLVLLIARRPWWQTLLVAFLLSWIHESLSWLIAVVVLAAALSQWLVERKPESLSGLAALAGWLLGLIARPNALGAAKIAYVQIFVLSELVHKGVPLTFGKEVPRIAPSTLFLHYSTFLGVFLVAIGYVLWRRQLDSPGPRQLLLAAGSLSVGFFLLTIASSERGLEPWVVFGVLFIGAAATVAAKEFDALLDLRRLSLWASAGVAVAGITCFVNVLFMYARHGMDALDYKPAMDWLKVQSTPGSIVYNLSWSEFPLAFVWDDHNRFVWGMDPVFLYAASPRHYWEAHWIMVGSATATTNAAAPGQPAEPVDTVTALTDDFHASYVVLRKKDNPQFFGFMRSDRHFRLAVDAGGIALFTLEPEPRQ